MENDPHGQEVRPILVIGDSHMESVTGTDIWDDHAYVQNATDRRDVCFLKGSKPRDSEYWSLAAALAARHRLLLSWSGNEHYITFLVRTHEDAFDFMCEGAPHLPLDMKVQIVPGAMVRAHFRACVAPMVPVLMRLKDAGADGLVVSPPPPKNLRDRDIRERMELFFLAQALNLGLRIDDVAFSSSTLMLKLWHELQHAQRQAAAQCGFDFLSPPPCTLDRDGFLKPEFWRADITHANALYGTAVLDQLGCG